MHSTTAQLFRLKIFFSMQSLGSVKHTQPRYRGADIKSELEGEARIRRYSAVLRVLLQQQPRVPNAYILSSLRIESDRIPLAAYSFVEGEWFRRYCDPVGRCDFRNESAEKKRQTLVMPVPHFGENEFTIRLWR